MQHLRELLGIYDSRIGQFFRSSLHGLEASLKKTKEQFPEDPGANICDGVLQDIQSLLQLPSPDNSANQRQNTFTTIKAENELKLSPLRDAFNSDKNLIQYLGDFQLHSQTDLDLWKEIQHKLLRLPSELARSWRERALTIAQDIGSEIDTSNIEQLRFKDDKDIYPGLQGSIQAKGLSLSTSENAFLDSQVLQGNEYEDLSDDLKLLACLVSICIYSISVEPDLHHALETVYRFDTINLRSNLEECNRYINTLKERFQRTIISEKNGETLAILRDWINIDEAINSLVFLPPADSDSWCGELQKKSRRLLLKKAKRAREEGHDVRIQKLSGVYANIHNLSSGYDLSLKIGGIPGEVQACLRVYARINQEELKGRVIYRSLQ